MSLTPGARLGPYEVLSLLGAGGMGEVYRARDHRLNRDVALKVLPDVLARDSDRLARFRREAQVLASLNHPNIAAIYGLEEQADVASGVSRTIQALVLELVDGPTLADRIGQGPLPLDEALPIARQIAEAFDAAHEHGVIHRDLKPANVKVRTDGTVKVLDFGLAKAFGPAEAGHYVAAGAGAALGVDLTASPTMTSPAMTRMGMILGTAAYMSPEQARGREVDRRADIWAFGCVVYEMLTGKPAFPGNDVSEVLAGVIKSDVAWDTLPADTPPRLRSLLRRSLQKDSKHRLRDIGDARLEIEEVLAAPDAGTVAATPIQTRGRERLAWSVAAIAILAAVAAGVTVSLRPAPALDTRVYHTSIVPPPGKTFAAALAYGRLALSPDSRRLAFVAGTTAGLRQLWVQPLDGPSAQALPGSEGASTPFWSPDSRFIGFYAGGQLKIVNATGGPPLALADTGAGAPGAAWNRENVILFATLGNVIQRISASGGPASPVTKLEAENGETQHWMPFFLPDGRHFLYVAVGSRTGGRNDLNGIYVTALDSTERKLLVPGGSNATYAEGYLLFLREQTLMAQPFDLERLELTGDPAPIAEQVATGGLSGRLGAFTVSEGGVLAYQSGAAVDVFQLQWVDRAGKPVSSLGDFGDYGDVELSPDGTRAAVSLSERGNRDIWLFDLARGLRTRFTFDQAEENVSAWSPDGQQLLFSSNRRGTFAIYRKAAGGSGSEDVVKPVEGNEAPLSWSRDGRMVLSWRGAQGAGDIWVVPLSGDQRSFPFLQARFDEYPAMIAPDGRWVAYASNESGRYEVYVTSFPTSAGKWQISTAGGNWPRWRRDGRELFYLAPDNRLMAAEVNGQGSRFEVGVVRALFQTQARVNRRYMYDVSADGQRFLINTLVEQAIEPITLVVNWLGALRK